MDKAAATATKPSVGFDGTAVVERCHECLLCRIRDKHGDLGCEAMYVMMPDGTVETAATDEKALDKIKAWFKANASADISVGRIEWRDGTGFTVFKGAAHEPAKCERLRGWHLRFSTKSWSDAFECPTCKTRRRFNLNYLGRKNVVCDGKRFTKVERGAR